MPAHLSVIEVLVAVIGVGTQYAGLDMCALFCMWWNEVLGDMHFLV
jgi:hypothetical protein